MICIVLRKISGGIRDYQAGEEVDVSEWPHADKLIDQRYLRVKSVTRKPREVDPPPPTVMDAPVRKKSERVLR